MNHNEIKDIIARIAAAKWRLENALEENGGELTPELLEQVDILEELKALLAGGVDDLGRWLKSVQDETAARKAEADAAARKVKNLKDYEDYIKFLVNQAMDAMDLPVNKKGEKVAKGAFYGFTRKTSTTNKVKQDVLNEVYLDLATDAARDAGLPAWCDVEIKTNVTRIKEYAQANPDEEEKDGCLCFIEETSTPSLGFTKPRANQKKEGEA